MSASFAITCTDLTYSYPGKTTKALQSIFLQLEAGKVHVILGPNGAGKTTFIRNVTTEFSPSRGQIQVLGYDSVTEKGSITRQIGVMPQQAMLYKQLTAWEHVYLFTRLKGLSKKESQLEAEKALTLMGLWEERGAELTTFSGGMLNAVNFAQAIAGNPSLLFLDEPTVGLDPQRRRVVWDYVRCLRGEKTVVLTTQHLDEAHALADHILVFHHGHVIHQGSLEDTLNQIGYELKLELPCTPPNLQVVQMVDKLSFAEQNDKIVIWTRNGRQTLQQLLEEGIELASITLQRPMLEEAYLNMLAEHDNEAPSS